MKTDAQTVFEFAYTTGELYNRHVELAQANADWKAWFAHVQLNVVPRFKREMRLTSSNWYLPSEEIAACAILLQSYYAEHVKEL